MKYFSYVITVFLLAFVGWKVREDWAFLSSINWNYSSRALFLVPSLLLAFGSDAISWHSLTKLVNEKVLLRDSIRIWFHSNITRLVPGGIWQYPSRIVLLHKTGVSKMKASYCTLFEVFFSLLAGALVFGVSLPFWELPLEIDYYSRYLGILVAIPFVMLVVASNKAVLQIILSSVARLSKRDISLEHFDFDKRYFFVSTGIFMLRFVGAGSVLFVLLSMVESFSFSNYVAIIGMFSLSWLIGFVAIFAPGGIGVTEGILTVLLSQFVPVSLAAVIAICLRVVLVVTEIGIVILINHTYGYKKGMGSTK